MPLSGQYAPSTSDWARKHAETYEASGGEIDGDLRGMSIIVLTSVGAKTGKLRKTAPQTHHPAPDGPTGYRPPPGSSTNAIAATANITALSVTVPSSGEIRAPATAAEASDAIRTVDTRPSNTSGVDFCTRKPTATAITAPGTPATAITGSAGTANATTKHAPTAA